MGYYRRKPEVIKAVQLLWSTWNEVCDLVGDHIKIEEVWVDPATGAPHRGPTPPAGLAAETAQIGMLLPSPHGDVLAREGDWICKYENGTVFRCKAAIFPKIYEEVTFRHPTTHQRDKYDPRTTS